jgi:hypothetical protein
MGDGEGEYREPEYDAAEDETADADWEPEEPGSTFIHWPRDPKLDPARNDLLDWFNDHPTGVFYGRQIEVILEKKYFHWITHKALRELTKEELIATELRITPGHNKLRLYWSKRNRYPKRAVAAVVNDVEEHSNPETTSAIGYHAESLFAVAAAREGFRLGGPAVRAFQGRMWDKLVWAWVMGWRVGCGSLPEVPPGTSCADLGTPPVRPVFALTPAGTTPSGTCHTRPGTWRP